MYNKKVLSRAVKNLDKAKAPVKKQDMILDPMGQWKYPGQPTRIPGNQITMQGVPYPVLGIDNYGNQQMMYPGQDYTFSGDYVDEFPMAKKGGVLPKLPNKKSSKRYSKNLLATNKLFTENSLIKKYRSPKGKFFDPNAKYYQYGGANLTRFLPQEETQFQKFYETLPDNLMDDDPSYDIRGYWASEGKPNTFNYDQPKESDGFYHGYSINSNTGEYLKAPTHPTFQHAVDEDRKIGYRPVTNVYGRNIAIENQSIANPEEQSFLRNTEGPVNYQDGGVSSLEGNYISNVIMNRNRGTDFVDRAYALGANPGTPLFNVPDDEQFGARMSHKMATGEDDSGQSWMFPTVLNPNNEGIKVPNQYADYISSEGYKYATGMKQKGGFHTDINKGRQFLRDWTYGQSIGMLQEEDGGYIELELTPEEIEEYKKGGYVVEDISVPQLTQAQTGQSMNYPSWYKGQSLDSPIPDFTGGDPRMKQENKYSTIGQYFDAVKTKADTIDQAPYKMLTYLGDPKAPKGHYDPEQAKYIYYNQRGGLIKAQTGKEQKSKAPWENYGIITYKDNPNLINSTANFDMISKVPVSQQYNEQIKHRLYTGNYGYDPKTGQLVKLKSSDRGTVSKEDQKMLDIQEDKKIQENNKDIIKQQEQEHLNSVINAGYDPATFAGGYMPESTEYKKYFTTPGLRSIDELQKIPWEQWNKDERNAWLEQGYYSTTFNPAFQLAALATPIGAAIGSMNAIANVPLDLYNKDYSTAALNALELLPVVKPFTKALGKGTKAFGTKLSQTTQKVLPQYKNANRFNTQRSFTTQGDIGKDVGTKLTTSDVQKTIDDQLKWITSEEYYKRRSANTGETYDQIFADVNKTINNAKDAKINVNAELPGRIQGLQTPRSINTAWGPPTVEVSKTAANAPMVLKHEVGHLYSPVGFDVSTSKLHRGFNNPNVASLPANKRGVYANYPKIGTDDMDEYLQLGYEQQVRHLNARDQILSKYNLDKEASLNEDQVYDFVTNWNKKIQNREAGFSDADSNFHFGKEEDYDDIWQIERNNIKQELKDKYDLNDPNKIAQLSKEEKKRLTEETNKLLSKKITGVLNKAWAIPAGIGVGVMTQGNNSSGESNQAPGGKFQFGGESEYEDVELTPEEIDWYLTNGYDLEMLPDDYELPISQSGSEFKNKRFVGQDQATVAKPVVKEKVLPNKPFADKVFNSGTTDEMSEYAKNLIRSRGEYTPKPTVKTPVKQSGLTPYAKSLILGRDKNEIAQTQNIPNAKGYFAASPYAYQPLSGYLENNPIIPEQKGLTSYAANIMRNRGEAPVTGKTVPRSKPISAQEEANMYSVLSENLMTFGDKLGRFMDPEKNLYDQEVRERAHAENEQLKRLAQKKGLVDIQEGKLDLKKIKAKTPVKKVTPEPAKFYQELGTVKDVGYSDNDLLSYRNQWDNKEGFEYIATPVKKDRKGNEVYNNVKGVGHFLLDASVSGKTYSHEYNKKFIDSAKKNNEWIPAFQRVNGDRVKLQYKKPDELTKSDIVVTPLRQMKYDEIKFDQTQRPEGFQKGIKEVKKSDGQGTYLLFKDRDGYSRFSGGSVVFIFKDTYGNTIVRDYAGSLNGIENEGINIKKEYKLKPGELTIGYHDVGSYSAKPKADKNNTLKISQWDGFNNNEMTGGALLIPND